MPAYQRICVEKSFSGGDSRLRLGLNVATAWGVEPSQPTECIGFFREEGELVCVPANRLLSNEASPLAEILGLENAHAEEVEVVPLSQLPKPKTLLAPNRLIRFSLTWFGKQFDLHLGKKVADQLGRTDTRAEVGVITWKGWLIILSKDKYERYLKEPW